MSKNLILLSFILCFFVAGQAFCAMEGLVGAWLFDDDSDQKAIDASKRGHDGKYIGNAKKDKNGKFGSALICDGTEAYVMVSDHDDFEFDKDFTIVCWFKNSVPPSDHSGLITKGYHRPAGSGGNSKPWYLVYFLKTGTVDLYLRDTKDTNSRAMGKTLINDDKWHHVAAMKEGNKVKIFVDGQEDGVADAIDAKYGQNDQPLVFMVHYDRWINGMMDEVALFNRALKTNEINQIMKGLSQSVLSVSPKDKLAINWCKIKSM
ncbi:MAG: LamG domain-containing protein [bacterium]